MARKSDPRKGPPTIPSATTGVTTATSQNRSRILKYGVYEPRIQLRKGATKTEVALVEALDPNDPAYKQGVRRGWLLYAIDGIKVDQFPGHRVGRGNCELEFRRVKLSMESWRGFAGL